MMKRIYTTLLVLLVTSIAYPQIIQEKWLTTSEGCKVLDAYYEDDVTMEWEGECKDGHIHGFGTLKKYVGSRLHHTYVGEYDMGKREGTGTMTLASDSSLEANDGIYSGQFIDNQAFGEGYWQFSDGRTYEGQIVNYRAHGNGVTEMSNGDIYEGYFVSDNLYTGAIYKVSGKVIFVEKGNIVEKLSKQTPGSTYHPELGKLVTEYFDENWERCGQKDAAFYRRIRYKSPNIPDGAIKDYFIDGTLQNSFTCAFVDYDDDGKNYLEGTSTFYHENGVISGIYPYKNNKLDGEAREYDRNGNLESTTNYYRSYEHGLMTYYYPNGATQYAFIYDYGELVENKYIEYDEDGTGLVVYNEDFVKFEHDWVFSEEDYNTFVDKENGFVIVDIEKDFNSFLQLTKYINVHNDRKLLIKADIYYEDSKSPEGYGLIAGFKDWDNYIIFEISNHGFYRILNIVEGLQLEISEWTKTEHIRKGDWNELQIWNFEEESYFLLNGNLITSDESLDFRGSNFGPIFSGEGRSAIASLDIKEFLPDYYEHDQSNTYNEEWLGNGSGIFVDPNGYIVTNYHVIEDADEIEVEFTVNDITMVHNATVIKSDEVNDLALIKIDDSDFSAFRDLPYNLKTSGVEIGTRVFALGYPRALTIMGTDIKYTNGTISAKSGYMGDITTFQTTTPVQPGNSGGPLFDERGNLIAINASILGPDNAENVTYSIKGSYVAALVDALNESVQLPSSNRLGDLQLTEQIKELSQYVVLIKVK